MLNEWLTNDRPLSCLDDAGDECAGGQDLGQVLHAHTFSDESRPQAQGREPQAACQHAERQQRFKTGEIVDEETGHAHDQWRHCHNLTDSENLEVRQITVGDPRG